MPNSENSLQDELKEIARELGIDFTNFSIEDLMKGMKVESEHKDVTGGEPIATAKIALSHLKEDPNYYEKLEKVEKTNATQSQKPNFYYARHMQPGTCRYDKEMILVDTDAVQQMCKTGTGIPVYINHQVGISIDDVKEQAAGYVTESFYNELDGWSWFKFMAIDDEVRSAVGNGWSVSNAYRPLQWGAGGTKNNVPYDREIIGAEFTHLAIVPNPRYENACIMTPDEFKTYQEGKKSKLAELHNSKTTPTKEESEMSKFEELLNGLGQLINSVKKNDDDASKKEGAAHEAAETLKKEAEEKQNAEVDVDGEKMPLKELINRYQKMNQKMNADAEEAKKKETEEKENAEEEEKKKADKKEEDEKTNGKGYFDQIQNAKNSVPAEQKITIETTALQIKRGQERYG